MPLLDENSLIGIRLRDRSDEATIIRGLLEQHGVPGGSKDDHFAIQDGRGISAICGRLKNALLSIFRDRVVPELEDA